MTIVERYLTNNPCYKRAQALTPKGLLIHSVGCAQPSAKYFLSSFNRSAASAMVHGFIDISEEEPVYYNTAPYSMRTWHCGGTANNTHIGIEVCEPPSIKYVGGATFKIMDGPTTKEYVERGYKAAVEVFAMLAVEFDLDPEADGVLISHHEGALRGVASNHGDIDHLWNQTRELGITYTMDGFRADVKKRGIEMINEAINNYLAELGEKSVADWAATDWGTAKAAGITDGSRPQALVTRQEVIAMITRALKAKEG